MQRRYYSRAYLHFCGLYQFLESIFGIHIPSISQNINYNYQDSRFIIQIINFIFNHYQLPIEARNQNLHQIYKEVVLLRTEVGMVSYLIFIGYTFNLFFSQRKSFGLANLFGCSIFIINL